MALRWTRSARSDLVRLYDFLQSVNVPAAARVVRQLIAGAKRIPAYPRLGTRLAEFEPREVRRILVGDYEIRYEVTNTDIFILRIFHVREDR
ncbi:MAG: type II toxin-antitoxin system RelE/ParE family toxin [Betaproteobacteria bacterium]|nr:type II toxin-antitoxin system RelE/ParE family toxin [Gammaproteobacteria bacterium]MDH3438728.1 type II toxin-antitoxin system RelE/ParE family toxin [Betaproteobacteria bacterium]